MTKEVEEAIKVLKNCWVMTTDHVLDEDNKATKLAICVLLAELDKPKEMLSYYEQNNDTVSRSNVAVTNGDKIRQQLATNEELAEFLRRILDNFEGIGRDILAYLNKGVNE